MICGRCGLHVPSGMTICPNCGNLLIDDSTYDSRQMAADMPPSTTPFPPPVIPQLEPGQLAITILGSGDTLVVDLERTITLGRYSATTTTLDLLDLSPYGSTSLGVSRRHAQLYFDADNVLCLRDLGSTNGTYVNGQMLEPEQTLRLISGTLVMLGRFSLYLTYI